MPNDFSDVDASADPDGLVLYLDWMAQVLDRYKRRIIELLDVAPGDRVLDIGCGAGHDLGELATRNTNPVGVDTSSRMLSASRERLRGRDTPLVLLAQADGAALPFGAACFAAVRIERVLQHAADPWHILAESRRVLRPGGRLVVFEPDWSTMGIDSDDPARSAAVVRGAMLRVRQPRIGLQLRRGLVDAGFGDVTCEPDVGSATSLDRLRWAFNVDQAVERAVATGLLGRRDADEWCDEMARRSESGRFWATLPRIVVHARA